MDMLKKYFPYSFGAKDLTALIIKVIVYFVAGFIVGTIASIIGLIPLIGPIIGWAVGLIANIYTTAGWIIAILDYLKILK